MAIVDFHDERLNVYLQLGASIDVNFHTYVHRMRQGHEERIGEWQDPLRQFNIAAALRDQDDLDYVIAFFRARRGQRYAFRFMDPLDYQVMNELFGTGDGVTTTFQLSKTYNSGLSGDGAYYIRPVFLPETGVSIYKNDVLQTSGVAVNTTTGVVTFTTPPTSGHSLKWTGTFSTPVRFLNDTILPLISHYQNYDIDISLMEQRGSIDATIRTETQSADFIETVFPDRYAERTGIGPYYGAIVLPSDSGYENRVSQYAEPKIRFTIADTSLSLTQMQQILAFFLNRKGRLAGFRVKDILDFSAENEQIGTGNGVATAFQLYKTYIDDVYTQTRTIYKPKSGITVYLDGIPASPQPALDTTTGIVTFSSPPSNGVVITWTGEFDVPARFDNDTLKISIVGNDIYTLNSIPLSEVLIDLPSMTFASDNTSVKAILTGCGVIPPAERTAVTKYIVFNGGFLQLGDQVDLQTNFVDMLKSATTLTFAFLVSHVSSATEQSLFYHQAWSGYTGYDFRIGVWGRYGKAEVTYGAPHIIPAFSSLTLSWFCGTDTQTVMNAPFKPKSIIGNDDGMRAVICTMSWRGAKLFASGTVYGVRDLKSFYGVAQEFNFFTCAHPAEGENGFATMEEVEISTGPATTYHVDPTNDTRFISGFASKRANLGAQNAFPSPGATNPFQGRMYEAFMLLNSGEVGQVIKSVHKPILEYWLSKYGTGYPFKKSPTPVGTSGAWWRADEGVTVVNPTTDHTVVTWEPAAFVGFRGKNRLTWTQYNTPSGDPKQEDVPLLGLPVLSASLYLADGKKIRKR